MDNVYLHRAVEERVKQLVREELRQSQKDRRFDFAIGIFRFVAEMMVAVGLVRYFS
jgi:hypothetical protein